MKRLPRKLKNAIEKRIEQFFIYSLNAEFFDRPRMFRLKAGEKSTKWTKLAMKILREEDKRRREELRKIFLENRKKCFSLGEGLPTLKLREDVPESDVKKFEEEWMTSMKNPTISTEPKLVWFPDKRHGIHVHTKKEAEFRIPTEDCIVDIKWGNYVLKIKGILADGEHIIISKEDFQRIKNTGF